MDKKLDCFLEDLYRSGSDFDSKNKVHTEQFLNITPDTGSFLSLLIQAVRARQVLEIGTSDGYSTIWIADALERGGGNVTTIESSERKFKMARENFERAGLSRYVDSRLGDARSVLKDLKDESADFVFLDAERPQYISYWRDIDRVLRTKGLLVVDNALSPKPEELVEFFGLIHDCGRYLSQTLQIGKGEMVALKQQRADS